jgi:hypothetical protein
MACLEVLPGDGPGAREVALAATGALLAPPPTWVLVEWEDGAPASMTVLHARRDGSDAPVPDLLTDSTGMAPLEVREGRFTFQAVRSDGVPHASDGPLLLPAPGLPLVRLVPEAR